MSSSAPDGDATAASITAAPPPAETAAVAHLDPMIVSESKPAEAPAAPPNENGVKCEDGAKSKEATTEIKEPKKSTLDEQTLYKQVKVVLMHAELKKTTFRSIAEQLNLLFGYDFTDPDNKQLLKGIVTRVLDEREGSGDEKKEPSSSKPKQLPPKKARTEEPKKEDSEDEDDQEDEEDEEEESEESEEKPKKSRARRMSAPAVAPSAAGRKKKRGAPEAPSRGHEELLLSSALEKVVHVKYATRVDATKLIWEYIYGLNLVEGGFVVCDEPLKELFGEEKFRSAQVEKRLTAHLSHQDGTPLIPPKKEKKPRDPNAPKRTSIFSAEKILAQPLADLLGKERMSRGDVVKALHEYFKKNNLQDPNNRSIINFDPALEAIFHRKKTTFFKLNKLLVGKLMDPHEVM